MDIEEDELKGAVRALWWDKVEEGGGRWSVTLRESRSRRGSSVRYSINI